MSSPRHTLLLVEDDEALRRALRRALSATFEVVAAASAEDALRALAAIPTLAVVIADERLGNGAPGHELLAEIARLEPRCVRVLVSGSPIARPAIADVFLRKPFDADDLVRELDERIGRP